MDTLFDMPPDWEVRWKEAGMPPYSQKNLESVQSVIVRFATLHDREEFLRLVDAKIANPTTKWIWYPAQNYQSWTKKQNGPVKVEQGKYPIYIISKGRWSTNYTAKNLDALGIEYTLVVEQPELDKYLAAGLKGHVIPLPAKHAGTGCSIPARNWCWEDSRRRGHERHWILDDNLSGFYCLNNNQKPKVTDFNPFIPIEQFTDHYQNIGLSGPNYEFFIKRRSFIPPYYQNNRVYSCILIRNDLPFRWRGRYNEDSDLSLRTLKAGYATVLFNYIQAKKAPTMQMAGGNTDTLYKLKEEDGRLKMAESLKAQHPREVRITRKWGRWQHLVDYSGFKQKLIPRR